MADLEARPQDRGQSELVGFVLVFGIVVLSVSLLTVTGYAGLGDAQDYERTEAAQAAMTALAEDVDAVADSRAPSRATELSLAEAKLSMGEPETIEIRGEHVSDPDENFTHTQEVRPLVWDDGDGSAIHYHGGAVIRVDDGSGVMVREPALELDPNATVVPVVATTGEEADAVGGSGTVLVRTTHEGTELVRADADEYDLSLEVTTEHPDAWATYLESQPGIDDCSTGGETVTCDGRTDHLVVTVEHVDVSIE